MKKRKILALILACATILSLVGCGNNATTDSSEKDTTGNTTVESENEPEIDQNAWKSGKFTFAGVELELGKTTLRELKTVVETISHVNKKGETKHACVDILYPNVKVKPHKTLDYLATPNIELLTDYSVIASSGDINVYNPTDTDIEMLDGYVCEIIIRYNHINPYAILDIIENDGEFIDLVLPNGVTFGTSMYDVIKLYGEPTKIEYTDYGDWYVYKDDTIKLLLNLKSNYVSEISYVITDTSVIE